MSELKEAYKYCSDEDLKEMWSNADHKEKRRITLEINRRKKNGR